MGVMRLVLAISVVLAHAGFKQLLGGPLAVQAFFIISGFYMAMVLTETYSSHKIFYLNRFLRLYPAYIAVVLVSAATYAISGDSYYGATYADFRTLGFAAQAYLLLTNIGLVFQDWALFLGVDGSTLVFVKNFRATDYELYRLLLVPQAWSLGLEIGFYSLAPFLNRFRSYWLALIALGSFGLRFFAYQSGFNHDPWTYRFFPFELALFIAGMLGYRVYRRTQRFNGAPDWLGPGVFASAILFICFYNEIALAASLKLWVLLAVIAVATPIIFRLTANWKWDRLIGELSYPVYLVHLLVIFCFERALGATIRNSSESLLMITLVVAVTIALAAAIHFVIERPVERVRHRRLTNALKAPAVKPGPAADCAKA